MATEAIERTEADEIRELARAEAEQFNAWLESEEEGEPVPVEYWQAFDAWQNAYDRRVLPIAAREMEDLAREYVAWDSSGESDPPTKFWTARQRANEACMKLPPDLPPIKSPAELVADKVSPRQIARMWRVLKEDGEPDIVRLEEELANPGSVLTPEHVAKIDQQRLAELGFVAPPSWAEEQPAPPQVAAATLEQLIADRANVAQIARIKAEQYGTLPEAWEKLLPQLAALMGVSLSMNATDVVNQGGQSVSEKIYGEEFVRRGQEVAPQIGELEVKIKQDGDDEEPPESEPVDVDAKIVALFEGGQDITAIAREVELPVRKVKGVITKWQKEMQQDGEGESEE
jgi:hypothetical protein